MLIKIYRLLSVYSLMVPSVVFLEELCHSNIQLQSVACRVQVDVLPLQSAEESFDEGIVGCTAFAIHRDLDPGIQQGADPMLAGILPWSELRISGFP